MVQNTTTMRTSNAAINEKYQVWLFMERVKPGLTKKLTHWLYGPFRVKKQVEEISFELEFADRSRYLFYPVVYIPRSIKVTGQEARSTTKLVQGLGETDRLDFDEELLPEDSWTSDESSGRYEVEAILNDDTPRSTTTTDRIQRKLLVKWVGYDEPKWKPLTILSCGGLVFDYLRRKKRKNRLQMVHVADER